MLDFALALDRGTVFNFSRSQRPRGPTTVLVTEVLVGGMTFYLHAVSGRDFY